MKDYHPESYERKAMKEISNRRLLLIYWLLIAFIWGFCAGSAFTLHTFHTIHTH